MHMYMWFEQVRAMVWSKPMASVAAASPGPRPGQGPGPGLVLAAPTEVGLDSFKAHLYAAMHFICYVLYQCMFIPEMHFALYTCIPGLATGLTQGEITLHETLHQSIQQASLIV